MTALPAEGEMECGILHEYLFWCGLVWFGLVCFALLCFGLPWSGSVRFDLVWFFCGSHSPPILVDPPLYLPILEIVSGLYIYEKEK